ncbi:SecE/sec61-gamma protein transport protein [Tripterygium wilfordii]|uniref:SecE/sec61-gamma protein transport protein n=1 Tax=Tripterygium wilfordii TaxID=458696 RepID=A0A7J7CKP2_TRIWF|nr:SecE/sec61-gamma protein transport protein [Tripterygium wilfordii]
MDAIESVFNPLREFAKDRVHLAKRCLPPARSRRHHEAGFPYSDRVRGMGLLGFFVKLIFIPVNDTIVGSR